MDVNGAIWAKLTGRFNILQSNLPGLYYRLKELHFLLWRPLAGQMQTLPV